MKNKKVSISVARQKIRGTLVFPKKLKPKNPAVLFIHGWSSNQRSYLHRARALADQGIISLTINLRGHGGSDGRLTQFSRADHLKDVLAAYDFLKKQKKVDSNKMGVVGASYGGYLAALLSSKRKIKNLILRAPALYRDQNFDVPTAALAREDERVYRRARIDAKDNRALSALTKYKNNFLLIESELDDVCPKQTTRNYLRAVNSKAKTTHQIIKRAQHSLKTKKSKQAFIEILSRFFYAT